MSRRPVSKGDRIAFEHRGGDKGIVYLCSATVHSLANTRINIIDLTIHSIEYPHGMSWELNQFPRNLSSQQYFQARDFTSIDVTSKYAVISSSRERK